MPKKFIVIPLITIALLAAGAVVFRGSIEKLFLGPTESSISTGVAQIPETQQTSLVATDLDTPWGIDFLPNGDMLVTERFGQLTRIGQNGQSIVVEGVEETKEGGLLGVAVHPNYETNNFIYLYVTREIDGALTNSVEQFVLKNDVLSEQKVLLADIPGAQVHDGGRIAFGPDGKLYITTGDAGVPDSAQDTRTLVGKILRMNDDGSVPGDNPFSNFVYSLGHRNPQGIAWDDQGRLWSSEHGPSGAASGNDELNLIEKGGNYGWPIIKGTQTAMGMIPPVVESGADETWAPGSLTFSEGSLFFAGLRAQTLYEAVVSEDATVTLKAHLREQYGRLRTVHAYDDFLYLTTSNKDGRGDPREQDDKIIKIPRTIFND